MAEMKRRLEDAAGEAAAASLSREVKLREEAVARLDEERRAWSSQKQRQEAQVVSLQVIMMMIVILIMMMTSRIASRWRRPVVARGRRS